MRLGSKRILLRYAKKITSFANHDFRFEWQFARQRSAEFSFLIQACERQTYRQCRVHIYDTIIAQSAGVEARAKR